MTVCPVVIVVYTNISVQAVPCVPDQIDLMTAKGDKTFLMVAFRQQPQEVDIYTQEWKHDVTASFLLIYPNLIARKH